MEPEVQFSYKPYELSQQRIVSPPIYRMHKGTLKRFDTCEKSTITNFTSLLQYTATDAILGKLPTFMKYNLDGIFFYILNYTADIVTLSNKRRLCINKNTVLELPEKKIYIIAYKVEGTSNTTYFEIKEENRSKAYSRFYNTFENGKCTTYTIPDCLGGVYTQHYTHISKAQEVIAADSNLKMLIQHIPNEADLIKNPKLLYFSARVNSCFFTVLNYTNHDITFDISRNLCIDNEKIGNFLNRHCHVVAYHLERYPEIICFQDKEVFGKKLIQTFFAQKDVKQDMLAETSLTNRVWKFSAKLPAEIFEDARIHKTFKASKAFFSGINDHNSILSHIPQEIFMHIFSNYDIQRFTEELQTK